MNPGGLFALFFLKGNQNETNHVKGMPISRNPHGLLKSAFLVRDGAQSEFDMLKSLSNKISCSDRNAKGTCPVVAWVI